MTLCKCGCGQETKPGNRYINGHNWNGKPHTTETKQKISESLSGKNCHWYGKHLSEETKQKMSQSHMGHETSEEARQKMSQSKTGPKNNRFIHGRGYILAKHLIHKKEECLFGCDSNNYEQHHEPAYENILVWEGRLVNLCSSCHKKVHYGSLKLPEGVGIKWTLNDTAKLIGD